MSKPSLVDWIAVIVAAAAATISVFALRTSADSTASAARAEVVAYANEMVRLDREADERNGTQMTLLAEQSDAVIDQYGQGRLHLAASTYRVLANYTDLGTENRALAQSFGERAVSQAQQDRNVLEEIRAHRVLADVAGQGGDVGGLQMHVEQALGLASSTEEARRSATLQNSLRFTAAFAVFDSLWAAQNGGDCKAALEYAKRFAPQVRKTADDESLEVSRRAYRLRYRTKAQLCGLSPKSLRVDDLTEVWLRNHQRT